MSHTGGHELNENKDRANLLFEYDKDSNPKFQKQGQTIISFHYEDELNLTNPFIKIESQGRKYKYPKQRDTNIVYISKDILEMIMDSGWEFQCEECHKEAHNGKN